MRRAISSNASAGGASTQSSAVRSLMDSDSDENDDENSSSSSEDQGHQEQFLQDDSFSCSSSYAGSQQYYGDNYEQQQSSSANRIAQPLHRMNEDSEGRYSSSSLQQNPRGYEQNNFTREHQQQLRSAPVNQNNRGWKTRRTEVSGNHNTTVGAKDGRNIMHTQHANSLPRQNQRNLDSRRSNQLDGNRRALDTTPNTHIKTQHLNNNDNPDIRTLVLESETERGFSTAKNNSHEDMLVLKAISSESDVDRIKQNGKITPSIKNLLATVQLPRPRLIPFTPMVTKQQSQSQQSNNEYSVTAASFARNAVRAGYLSKLGASISEYKRRFFVLKPTTFLYYFVSPTDTEPRGCIDLEGALGKDGLKIRDSGCLADGRFRFEIMLPSMDNDDPDGTTSDDQETQRRVITLEARNEEVGREWIRSLTVERLSYSKNEIEQLNKQINNLRCQEKQYEKQIDNYRLIEVDRDGAIEDAKNWKDKYENLNDALKTLKRWVSRPPKIDHREDDSSTGPSNGNDKREDTECKDEVTNEKVTETEISSLENVQPTNSGEKTTSFPIAEEDELLERIELPGTEFASLSNACRGLHENLRITSIEANTAIEDVSKINQINGKMEKRIAKAEKIICKLWEENCEIRDNLKSAKQEKKVLVKEVKSLIEKEDNAKQEISRLQSECDRLSKNSAAIYQTQKVYNTEKKPAQDVLHLRDPLPAAPKRQLATPEKKLLFDLEEHVNSSLRLHEEFLTANGVDSETSKIDFREDNPGTQIGPKSEVAEVNGEGNTSGITSSACTEKVSNLATSKSEESSGLPHREFNAREESSTTGEETDDDNDILNRTFSPLRPKDLSLMDKAFVDNDLDVKSEITSDSTVTKETTTTGSNIDSRLLDDHETSFSDEFQRENSHRANHPLLELSTNSEVDTSTDMLLSSLQSEHFSNSIITENGRATSQLISPLVDVVHTGSRDIPNSDNTNRNQLYHLTFYSSKIGLQFQKVAGQGSSGILTDAMTEDILDSGSESATEASRTAAELRRISTIRNNQQRPGKNSLSKGDKNLCPVIVPADIVLVCGFYGFDESANNTKPSLGARLVAFDGISVERGPWTFDTVKKAIKARGRPLTLSFRDDFLTTKQRSVLTKAAAEVNSSIPPPRPTLQYRSINTDNKFHQQIHESTDASKRPGLRAKRRENESNSRKRIPRSNLSQRYPLSESLDPMTDDSDADSTLSGSVYSRSEKWASFSETDSSSVFSTKFGPFMAGLMSGLSNDDKKKEDGEAFTPDYFRRAPESLDCIPHHRNFKSNLL